MSIYKAPVSTKKFTVESYYFLHKLSCKTKMPFLTPLILSTHKASVVLETSFLEYDSKKHTYNSNIMTTDPDEEMLVSHSMTKVGAWPVKSLHLSNKVKQTFDERQKPKGDMRFAGHLGLWSMANTFPKGKAT